MISWNLLMIYSILSIRQNKSLDIPSRPHLGFNISNIPLFPTATSLVTDTLATSDNIKVRGKGCQVNFPWSIVIIRVTWIYISHPFLTLPSPAMTLLKIQAHCADRLRRTKGFRLTDTNGLLLSQHLTFVQFERASNDCFLSFITEVWLAVSPGYLLDFDQLAVIWGSKVQTSQSWS